MATRRTSGWATAGFWIAAVAGVPIMVLAWFWFGQSSGQRPAGECDLLQAWGAVLHVPLLVIAHGLGVFALLLLALRAVESRPRAVLRAAAAVAAASIIGMLVAQWFWRGELFAAGASTGFCGV